MELFYLENPGTAANLPAMLVMIRDSSGEMGLGEVAAATGQPNRAAMELLAVVASRLPSGDAAGLNPILDALFAALPPDTAAGSAVRCAVDIALHDLMSRRRGLPVHALIGGAYRDKIGISKLTHAGDQDFSVLEDYPAIRLACPADARPLAANRIADAVKQIPASVQIDIDAAGIFANPAIARVFMEGLLRLRPRLNVALLDPLDPADLVGHAMLRSTVPVPIMLETPLRSATDMVQIVRLGAADRVSANLDRLGGLREAMRVASIAEASGIGITPTSFARTAVGNAAVLHFAAALHDNFPSVLEADSDGGAGAMDAGFAIGPGAARLSPRPGLGVVLRPEMLRAFRSVN